MPGMKGQPPKSSFPLEQGTSADSRGTVVPGPATLGSRAWQSYMPVAGLSWSTVAPPWQGRGDMLEPRESFLMAGEEREAVRSKS